MNKSQELIEVLGDEQNEDRLLKIKFSKLLALLKSRDASGFVDPDDAEGLAELIASNA